MTRMTLLSDCTADDERRILASRDAGEFVWLDLVDPAPQLVARVGELLQWHPLLVEDLQHRDQRPKVEEFADHVFVVAYGASIDVSSRRVALHEHAIVVHGSYLVTVRHDAYPDFTHLRTFVGGGTQLSEAALVHRVLDAIVDSTTDATDEVTDEVDRLERAIDVRVAPDVLEELRRCRRNLVTLRRTAISQRDALQSLAGMLDSIPGFEVGLRDHFRDVLDHAQRAVGELEVGQDLLDATFEAYYTMLVAKQGIVSQRLSVVATIFLPLTFVTGFFGQNFTWMVDAIGSRSDFLLLGVGTSVVTALVLLFVFLRLRWW